MKCFNLNWGIDFQGIQDWYSLSKLIFIGYQTTSVRFNLYSMSELGLQNYVLKKSVLFIPNLFFYFKEKRCFAFQLTPFSTNLSQFNKIHIISQKNYLINNLPPSIWGGEGNHISMDFLQNRFRLKRRCILSLQKNTT